jgi:hypothetical protein
MSLDRRWTLVAGQLFVAMGSGLFGAVLADGRSLGARVMWFISSVCLILVGVLLTALEEKGPGTSARAELTSTEPSPTAAP